MAHATSSSLAPDTSPAPIPRAAWLILIVVLIADIIDLIDATVTNIAAPTIAAHLGGGNALIQWLGASYAVAFGIFLVVGGRLGDRFGRKRLFLIGLVGFTLASVGCGLAFSPASIIVLRLVQGALGALMIPQGFGMIVSHFPREQMGKAFSVFGPAMGLSAVLAPILAGVLIEADLGGVGWRMIFFVNLVVGIIAFVVAWRVLPDDAGDPTTRIDVPGAVLLGGAMLGVIAGLIDGTTNGWAGLPLGLLGGGAVCFVLFAWRQVSAPAPLIQPTLFRNRGFTSGLILGLAFFAAVAGLNYVLSIFLQTGLHRTPFEAALAMTPLALGLSAAAAATAGLVARLGRTLVMIGIVIVIAGAGVLLALVTSQGASLGSWALTVPFALIGMGMGTAFGAIFDVAIGDIDPAEAGSASGTLSSVQQLANAFGAAVVTTVFFRQVAAAGEVDATRVSLMVVIGLLAGSLLLTPMLPRRVAAEPGAGGLESALAGDPI